MFGDVEPERFLYHYTSRQVALGSILAQGQLRLGPLSWTNDPRESKQWLVSLSSSVEPPESEEFFRIVGDVDRLIRGTTTLACLTRDDPEGLQVPPNEVFARGFAHSRMWAQYAGGHRGVCLIFERERLTERMEAALAERGKLYRGPVAYANRPHVELDASNLFYDQIEAEGLEAVVEQHVEAHWSGLFFVKNTDWASEWEYRYVLRGREPAPAFVDIKGCLVGLVLGEDFPAGDEPTVRHLIEALEISNRQVARCLWRNGFPVIVPALPG